jgi:hypothetical protein
MLKRGQCYLCFTPIWRNCPHCNNLVPTKKLSQGFLVANCYDKTITKVSVAYCKVCEKGLTDFGMKQTIKNLKAGGECTNVDESQELKYETWEEEIGQKGFWEATNLE